MIFLCLFPKAEVPFISYFTTAISDRQPLKINSRGRNFGAKIAKTARRSGRNEKHCCQTCTALRYKCVRLYLYFPSSSRYAVLNSIMSHFRLSHANSSRSSLRRKLVILSFSLSLQCDSTLLSAKVNRLCFIFDESSVLFDLQDTCISSWLRKSCLLRSHLWLII